MRRRAATSSTMRPSTGRRGRVAESGRMPVKLDSTERLFQPGECPDAALYCGWYSLGKYVDAFTWKPGAVAYHIASSECATLKQKGSRVWCKRMLEEGAAAVIGPVDEPYVQAFPVPEIFFGLLVEGYLTLAECYAASTPWLSWRMVLIGDPLYRPFANAGRKKGAAAQHIGVLFLNAGVVPHRGRAWSLRSLASRLRRSGYNAVRKSYAV